MNEPDQLHHLLRRHFQGEMLTNDEKETLHAWRKKNETSYLGYKKIWEESALLKLYQLVNAEESWQQWSSRQNRATRTWQYAAAAAVAILLASVILFFQANAPVVYTVGPNDEPQLFLLADSSRFWLNRNSTLIVKNDFNETDRKVALTGEGYFEVSHQRNKPFVVENSFSSITVLGTTFNTLSNDSINAVQLLEGSVSFSGKSQASLTLMPGEEVIFSPDGDLKKSTFSNENFLSWKTGRLIFEDQPMGAVAKSLEDHYRMEIDITDPQLATCRITLMFDNLTLEEVLNELSFLLEMEYSIDDSKVTLNGKGCDE